MWHDLLLLCLVIPALSANCPEGYTECGEFKCFMAVRQNKTWPAALKYCAQTGGTLASITSNGQNDCVNQLTSTENRGYWLGLAQIGDAGWTWTDGSEMSFNKWKPNEKEKEYPFAVYNPNTANWYSEKSGVIFGQYFVCSSIPQPCTNE